MIGNIAKRTSIGALLLMIMPVLVWVSGWRWQPEREFRWMKEFYWLTQPITSFSVRSCVLFEALLIAWLIWCLRYRLKSAICLTLIITMTLLIGQGIKYVIKDLVQEDRPFVVWLGERSNLDPKTFYAMPLQARKKVVAEILHGQEDIIPLWLQNHWCEETSLSFPSGHTIFAASFALFAIGLQLPLLVVVVLMLWACLVISSRLALGMHWPHDIIMGVVISLLLIPFACLLVRSLDSRC